jgi:hypothetical protein
METCLHRKTYVTHALRNEVQQCVTIRSDSERGNTGIEAVCKVERVTGFEPVISTLGKSHVATTLNPHVLYRQRGV